MKPIFFNILLIISVLSTIGCSPTYYQPTLVNAPNFHKKGQAYLAAHSSLGFAPTLIGATITDFSSLICDVQAAYAITDHWAIQGNYEKGEYGKTTTSTAFFSTKTTTQKTMTKGTLGEFAIGYFRPINESIALSLYGGYGSGWIDNNWDFEGASSAKLRKYFLQGTIGTIGTNAKRFELIGSAKLARLNYHDLSQTYTEQTYIDAFNVLKTPFTIAEFGTVARVGFKNIKFQLQGSFMHLFTITNPPLQYEGLSVGLGICVQFNKETNQNATSEYEFF